MGLFNGTWIKRLKRKFASQETIQKTKIKTSSEVDKAFDLLVECFPKQSSYYGRLEFTIGHYIFQGGWLSDEFYFDVYDLDKEFKIDKEGRIYVCYHKFQEAGVVWSAHKVGESGKVVDDIKIVSPDNLYKYDFIKSINFIVPGLAEE